MKMDLFLFAMNATLACMSAQSLIAQSTVNVPLTVFCFLLNVTAAAVCFHSVLNKLRS